MNAAKIQPELPRIALRSGGLVRRKTYAAKCKLCGKIVRVRPAGGDWLNDIYLFSHRDSTGLICENYRRVPTDEIIEPNGASEPRGKNASLL